MAEHHPLGDIEYLRETLLKSYRPGFPIIKELIQNAEDANSTNLDFGWTEGIDNAEHPLLKSPALFFIDDGDFSDNNAKSIRYIIGGSSKPNQEGAIGKFGLGLKSVFHLCEAFFYLAPELENSKYERCSIFNPWAGAGGKDEFHQNWDTFPEQDREKIKKHLKTILDRKVYETKWFILWIPLRQLEHKTVKNEYEEDAIELDYIVRDIFPEMPKFLSEDNIEYTIGSLLPLLSNLSNICFWEVNSEKFNLNLSHAKRQNFANLAEDQKNLIQGDISLNQQKIIDYLGHEIILSQQCFKNIIASHDLPKKFKNIKPHCGVVFVKNLLNQSKSSLSIRMSVFLPIGEDIYIPCKSENSYLLLLHGYFFVDSGRTGILGLDKEGLIFHPQLSNDSKDDLLKKDWNNQLYKNLLSRILDTLKQFVNELNVSPREITAICLALLESNLFKQDQNRKIICQNNQWIYRLQPNGNKWVLLDIQERVLSIPNPPNELTQTIWQVFPGLINISQRNCLSLSNIPNLRHTKDLDKWSEQEIRIILLSLKAQNIFSNQIHLTYITSFLKQNSECIGQLKQDLFGLVKKAFCSLDYETIVQNKSSIHNFISQCIDDTKKLCFNCNNLDIKRGLVKLNIDILDILIIPQELNISSNNTQLNFHDAEELLKFIAGITVNKNEVAEILNLTKQVLKIAIKYINQIRSDYINLKFIIGLDCQLNQYQFFSLKELDNINYSKMLFKGEQANDLVKALKQALINKNIVLLNSDIADLIYGKQTITICNSKSCLELLTLCPQLSSTKERIKLLGMLLLYV